MSTLGDRLNAIHHQLVAGSRTASLDLFKAALDPVVGHIIKSVPGTTEEDARDHAVAAIIGHIEHPDRFDPAKASLWTYLCLIAMRDAIDAVRQTGERSGLMEKHGYDIELWGARPNNQYDEVEWKKDAEKIMGLHGNFIVQNDGEKRVLELMLDGEKETAAFAKALGLADCDGTTAEVKRVKDRINQRMKQVRDGL
jgi:DNA-directed RNA polymerase specialized sigma24 family protein